MFIETSFFDSVEDFLQNAFVKAKEPSEFFLGIENSPSIVGVAIKILPKLPLFLRCC